MERYLNDNPFLDARMQTMQVTLQFGEYKGIFQKEFGGDVLGLHILSSLCS